MNQYGYGKKKEPIRKRLNRIEGQVRGINNMVEQDKYCIDILTQISAARSALDKVALELLSEHARHCLLNSRANKADHEEKIEELITAINRMA